MIVEDHDAEPRASQSASTPVTLPSTLGSSPAPQIPDHELHRRIGQGSYGDVWLARNQLGTMRAVKIVHRAAFEDARPFEREFKGIQKFEPISRTHEGLVDILQVGRNDETGYFYYVMELADGEPMQNEKCKIQNETTSTSGAPDGPQAILNFEFHILNYRPRTLRSDLKRLGRLPVAECVRIGLSLADALAHLHQHGLVHRDIKPSNIIFVGGAPKLADIGLVADISEARSFVGTTGFIPPEGPGTAQADIYSFGKVLYEISTGHDRQDFPALPPNLRELPDADALIEFNEIVVKACATHPRHRYAAVENLQADLLHLQRGQSVIHKHTRDQRLKLASQIGLVTAAIVVLMSGGWLLSHSLERPPVSGEITGTANREARNFYRMGRFYWNKRTGEGLQKAVEQFQRAIDMDPKFARAYAGLADCYNLLAENGIGLPKDSKPKARDVAIKALSLDDKLAEAHASLAMFKKEFEWDWPGAEREFKKAIALDPNYATARHWYSQYLLCVGRLTEAVAQAESAVRLEPTSLIINANLAFCLMHARRYDEAIAHFEKTRDMDPNFANGRVNLGWAYEVVNRYDDAVAEWEKGLTLAGESAELIAALRDAYRAAGMPGYWRKKLELLQSESKEKALSPDTIAAIYARLGNTYEAFAWLDKACAERRSGMTYIYSDPVFDDLRSDPRFAELRRKMGLEN